ncbi:heavy-metal-associated domain-containing protein [Streptomyces sedi]|uniref:Heavy-metal-associated domain-containing protein n=1 Tax=Streptomyces sedi TaxID=555059 RepID=A0A5C4V9K7_9ACTN|nr:heavy-metal-associated domain-containing protein [Streptomyces sedi]TNM32176.1 heavy-metal-associated domain-containing protein [Streptomyces sedi]
MSAATAGTVETRYTVEGMTCGHCVSAVTEEVGALDGVAETHVELSTGLLRVVSAAPLDRAAVAGAVDEAGYRLAPEAPAAAEGGCCGGGGCH